MKPWENVVEIPEGEVGGYRIEHFTRPAGAEIPRGNMRTSLIGGQFSKPLVFDRETRWHRLSYDGGVWMTDLPIEQQQHDELLARIDYGSVLIGGLGVGYAVNVLAALDEIERIVVVEISEEVVAMVGPHIKDPDGKVEIVTCDLLDYLREEQRKDESGDEDPEEFDYAFFDIWQSDGEGTFFDVVCPLRMLSCGLIPDENVTCWNENVMRGQLWMGLQSRWAFSLLAARGDASLKNAGTPTREEMATPRPDDDLGAKYWNWACKFWEAAVAGKVTDESFSEDAGFYASVYGRPAWPVHWMIHLGRRSAS